MSKTSTKPATIPARPSVRLRTGVDRFKAGAPKTAVQPSPLLGLGRADRLDQRRKVALTRRTRKGIVYGLIAIALFIIIRNTLSQRANTKIQNLRYKTWHKIQKHTPKFLKPKIKDDWDWTENENYDAMYSVKSSGRSSAQAHIHEPFGHLHHLFSKDKSAKEDEISTTLLDPPTMQTSLKAGDWGHAMWEDVTKTLTGGHLEHHTYRPDGIMVVNPEGPHPVFDLIREAEKAWKQKFKRASKTLDQAALEYQQRYDRSPPWGFDKWWDYVQKNAIQLPDEYDQINRDILPFWGMNPEYLRIQQQAREGEKGTFTIVCENGRVSTLVQDKLLPEDEGGKSSAYQRVEQLMDLVRPIEEYLPDFRATFTIEDGPNEIITGALREQAVTAARYGYALNDPGEPAHLHGWQEACPSNSPLKESDPSMTYHPSFDEEKTFIWDHLQAMDPCNHTDLVQLNGLFAEQAPNVVPQNHLRPSFSQSKTLLHADILTVANERFDEDVGSDPTWEGKHRLRVLWRGSNTGAAFDKASGMWELSQRIRAVEMFNAKVGEANVLRNVADDRTPVGEPQHGQSKNNLNRRLMDIAFVGGPIQCAKEACDQLAEYFKFMQTMTQDEANEYRYILDLDGNAWSSRFHRLMMSNSLVLKSTVFPEWYTQRIQPWVHYVPIKYDYSDLYDIMTFFRGDFDEEGFGHNDVAGHDHLAKKIALQGKEWVKQFWRKEDMIAYMFRLFLEYARVMEPDREYMTYDRTDAPLDDDESLDA